MTNKTIFYLIKLKEFFYYLIIEKKLKTIIVKSLHQIKINRCNSCVAIFCLISIKVSAFDHVLQQSLSIINSHRDETVTKSNGK